ncbi:sigma-70 family RNA polymerase sigma factor [Acinetobacter sp. YH12145]|uniref:RNA polymerase sigma factor n=1 Tax=Acinetobacter sp. YH12145 TaxID=2601129 RepID=UPI0015D42B65
MKVNQQNILFDQLYSEHHEWLLKRLTAMTRNRYLAEDITQSTFLIVYLKYYCPHNSNEKINFPKSFLYTIGRNLLFNYYEHEKVISENAENFTLYSRMYYESSINSNQLMDEVKQLLDPRERDIFILWCFYGYTLKEISQFVHLSPSRVFIKLKNSKKKLRSSLSANS